jgi:hypothetical protein
MYDFITSDRKHPDLFIFDVQRKFTLIVSTAEIPRTLHAVHYIQR